MANSILTPTAVTRKIQQVLHGKLVLAKKVNRQYDDSYAQTGGKIDGFVCSVGSGGTLAKLQVRGKPYEMSSAIAATWAAVTGPVSEICCRKCGYSANPTSSDLRLRRGAGDGFRSIMEWAPQRIWLSTKM